MAHVHGAKAVATTAKVAGEAVCPLHAAEAAAKGGMAMGSMMEHGAGRAMAPMTKHGAMAAGAAATGAIATASAATGHSLLRRVLTHPLVLFGAGLAVGYLIHQYREEIINGAHEPSE